MKLTNPTDSELNAAFAEKVAGWHKNHNAVSDGKFLATDLWHLLPNYCCSADAVIPFLEKWRTMAIDWDRISGLWSIGIGERKNTPSYGNTFPRAAVIALLLAHGVEVEFTK